MIIIETPAPPTRERLVLVPPDAVSRTASEPALNVHTSAGRDATPADLERGGYERLGPEVLRVSAAEWRELKLRAEGREAHGEPGTLAHLRNDLRDAISRAEAAEGLLIQRETELRLAREDGAAVERQMREARSAADASFVRANRAEMRAETAERERDEARDCGQVGVCAVTPGCQRHWAERARELLAERDTLRAERDEASKTLLEAGCGSVLPLAERVALLVDERAGLRADLRGAKEFARALEVELDTLRAELARLSDGGPTYEDFRAKWISHAGHGAHGVASFAREQWRAGVAYERARQQQDRATEDELEREYNRARRNGAALGDIAGIRAVADRVRQERCLVAQAVADPLLDSVSVGAVMGGGIRVRIVRRVDSLANTLGETKDVFCERADVPSTLARLLGEVAR